MMQPFKSVLLTVAIWLAMPVGIIILKLLNDEYFIFSGDPYYYTADGGIYRVWVTITSTLFYIAPPLVIVAAFKESLLASKGQKIAVAILTAITILMCTFMDIIDIGDSKITFGLFADREAGNEINPTKEVAKPELRDLSEKVRDYVSSGNKALGGLSAPKSPYECDQGLVIIYSVLKSNIPIGQAMEVLELAWPEQCSWSNESFGISSVKPQPPETPTVASEQGSTENPASAPAPSSVEQPATEALTAAPKPQKAAPIKKPPEHKEKKPATRPVTQAVKQTAKEQVAVPQKTIDERFVEIGNQRCGKPDGFIEKAAWVICTQPLRFELCKGIWSENPPAGQQTCKGSGQGN